MAQLNIRLSPEIRLAFRNYAASVGLDDSELARLLVIREMRVRRVLLRKHKTASPEDTGQAKSGKLTAHFHSVADRDEFDRYAQSCGLQRASAARKVVELELHEQWLRQALAWHPRIQRREV